MENKCVVNLAQLHNSSSTAVQTYLVGIFVGLRVGERVGERVGGLVAGAAFGVRTQSAVMLIADLRVCQPALITTLVVDASVTTLAGLAVERLEIDVDPPPQTLAGETVTPEVLDSTENKNSPATRR